jgi:GT2 family glycosyltransferase
MMLVVPTLTRHDLLRRMLGSIDDAVSHLVVIDNSGCGVELPDGSWERATVLTMPCNLGVAASWNLAIKMAHREPFVMIVSDDVRLPKGALNKFAEQSGEDRLVVSATWPHWCAFTIGMGVVSQLGLFDEGYYPAYYEDTDYERRMAHGGVERLLGPAVWHDNSSTLNTPGANWQRDRANTANLHLYQSGKQAGFDPYRWRAQAWVRP